MVATDKANYLFGEKYCTFLSCLSGGSIPTNIMQKTVITNNVF